VRYETLAMCNWLLHGIHDADSLRRFVEHEERFLIREHHAREQDRSSPFSTELHRCRSVRSGAGPARSSSILAPKSLNAIRSEGQMCYVVCRHRLGLEYSEGEVASASKRFLKRNMNTWLLDGVPDRAVQWMKLVHLQEGTAGISPKEAVLMCYKCLPDTQSRVPGKTASEINRRIPIQTPPT